MAIWATYLIITSFLCNPMGRATPPPCYFCFGQGVLKNEWITRIRPRHPPTLHPPTPLVANLEANLEPTWCQLGSNRRLSFLCCRMWEKDKPFGHPAGSVETRADNDRGRTLRFFVVLFIFTSHHLNMLAVQTPNS